MGIRSALYADLIACDALTTALGATADLPKVFPHVDFVWEPFPYVTFKRSDEPGDHSLLDTDGFRTATFILNAWSTSTDQCESIVEILRPRLEAFVGKKESHGVHVRYSKTIGEEDDDIPPDDGTDARWYFTSITLQSKYKALS